MRYLSKLKVARLLNVSLRTVERMVRRKALRSYSCGRKTYFLAQDVERLMDPGQD